MDDIKVLSTQAITEISIALQSIFGIAVASKYIEEIEKTKDISGEMYLRIRQDMWEQEDKDSICNNFGTIYYWFIKHID